MREWEWEGMGINILLREGMGMFLYTTMAMGWEWEFSCGNGIKKVISAHLYVLSFIRPSNRSLSKLLHALPNMPIFIPISLFFVFSVNYATIHAYHQCFCLIV